jgi:hypothetical protein
VTLHGRDFSHFNTLPADLSGDSFDAHKCTQGTTFVDPKYASRAPIIRAAGKVFIAYHFGTMSDDPKAQAAWFKQHAALVTGDVIALDWENPADGSADDWAHYTSTEIRNQAVAILASLAKVDHRELVYMNRSAYGSLNGGTIVAHTDGLWIASPNATPTMPYLFWQFTISNGIDQDQESRFATLAGLKGWALMTNPTTPSVDSPDVLATVGRVDALLRNAPAVDYVNAPANVQGENNGLANALSTILSQAVANGKALDALTAKVNALNMGDVLSIPDGTTFTASVPVTVTPPAAS